MKIKLTESKLKQIVAESVKKVLKEMTEYELERFCERNPDCGCDCMKCPAFAEYYREENGLNENSADDEALFDRVRNLKPTDEMPDEYYDWDDEWSTQGLDNAKIIQIPVNFLEEIFPGEYDSSRVVDGDKITYEYDRLGTPEERAKFFNYCKNNKYLSNVILNVKKFDDGVLDSIEKEDEIVNYIKRYPNKKFVRYFMKELNFIKRDVAEFCRDYNNEQ